MTKVSDEAAARPVPLAHGVELWAVGTAFRLALRQHLRARRLIVLLFLSALPGLIAVLVRSLAENPKMQGGEIGLVFHMLPHVLVPLIALLYACGMIQDEIEDQTLTYLLIRPVPKWALYGAKFLATVLVCAGLTVLVTFATYTALWLGRPEFADGVGQRAPKAAALLCLSVTCYGAIFGALSLVAKRSLVLGIAYTILLEGVLANIPFVFRRLTVVYYFRDLAMRWGAVSWLGVTGDGQNEWSIDLATAPSARECLLTLGLAAVSALLVGMLIFSTREFRVKTPEGN